MDVGSIAAFVMAGAAPRLEGLISAVASDIRPLDAGDVNRNLVPSPFMVARLTSAFSYTSCGVLPHRGANSSTRLEPSARHNNPFPPAPENTSDPSLLTCSDATPTAADSVTLPVPSKRIASTSGGAPDCTRAL